MKKLVPKPGETERGEQVWGVRVRMRIERQDRPHHQPLIGFDCFCRLKEVKIYMCPGRKADAPLMEISLKEEP